jgi:chromosome partitioning protein
VALSTHPDKRRPNLRKKTRVISVANQKGGVGKTTTAVNLGTALAAVGRKVLIIDLDPQANATTGLGLIHGEAKLTSYDVVIDDVRIEEAIVRTLVPGLWIVPTSVHLSAAEIELVGVEDREYVLRDKIVGHVDDFDYVLIDCPPALGLLTINALVASDAVLVPLQCEYYALEGMSHLVRTIERVRGNLNPHLELQGVVLTMFDRRNNLCDMVAEDVRDVFGDKVYQTVIPRNVRVSEAPSHGKPVLLYDLNCAGSQAYAHLASEVLKRERALRDGQVAA